MKPTTKINVNNICSLENKYNDQSLTIKMNNGDCHVKYFKTEDELKSFELEITEKDKNLSNFIEI